MEIARQRAQSLGRHVEIVGGDAQALPFPDRSFDTVICTLALCSIPDERQAIAEVWRVLRPDGCFIALEHVQEAGFRIDYLKRQKLGIVERLIACKPS